MAKIVVSDVVVMTKGSSCRVTASLASSSLKVMVPQHRFRCLQVRPCPKDKPSNTWCMSRAYSFRALLESPVRVWPLEMGRTGGPVMFMEVNPTISGSIHCWGIYAK
ncbi:hypothetical protein L3X38_001902 [Prunus dulcis]|uniref:Uncharacterized protein n=1 Tax=Prunus dulcis TaxID=3755 RepID=A0AAD4ZK94_PRUDU|nr:hypothetical protein L3X38_001902 [Prunus dulcis]